ncbi:MAG: mechanosensitive ion channel, partial [Caulobacterales bacterium]|nr:mechanosensitive ion channel [Caulobacterales bacterium]
MTDPAPDIATLAWLLDPAAWPAAADSLARAAAERWLTLDTAVQAAAIALAALIARLSRHRVKAGAGAGAAWLSARNVPAPWAEALVPMARPAMLVTMFALAGSCVRAAGFDAHFVRIAISLSFAWLAISTVTRHIDEPFWARTAAVVAWTAALINAFALWGVIGAVLDGVGVDIADRRVSLLILLRAAVVVVALFAAASWTSQALRRRIESLPRIEPSLRILFAKTAQVALLFLASAIGLTVLGIDLSAFAIFGGAIGLGIGFGLQKIFANLVSGVILLLDRSIKPGDVIEIDETYGWVNSLGLRYASVITRDGKEHLIPNEMLITDKVVNWSYSNKEVRVKRRLRVEYETDLREAVEL